MTMAFEKYSLCYDAFYHDKDYEAECDFLEEVFARYAGNTPQQILELGCGTGGHALVLARRGYDILGVDRSESMLAEARRKARTLQSVHSKVDFVQGDIRSLAFGREWDAALAMFAVVGYQVTNDDLDAVFHTARIHLKEEGLFIFDTWFGPAVINELPSDRWKIAQKQAGRILRLVHSELDVATQTVKVHYKILHFDGSQVVDEIDEVHEVRPLFLQEVKYFASRNAFELVEACPFMKLGSTLSINDWNATFVLRAVK